VIKGLGRHSKKTFRDLEQIDCCKPKPSKTFPNIPAGFRCVTASMWIGASNAVIADHLTILGDRVLPILGVPMMNAR
jgi:hypothetical protein